MIETTTNKIVYVTADNPSFAFPIPFFAPENLHCFLYDADTGAETELVRGTDFTVEAKDDYSGGATVTLLALPTAGSKLAILRKMPITQDLNLPEYGKLPSQAVEKLLDKIVMICQQLKEDVSRAFLLSYGQVDYDPQEFYNLFRTLVAHGATWADTASEAAADAAASANDAAASAGDAAAAAAAVVSSKANIALDNLSSAGKGVIADAGLELDWAARFAIPAQGTLYQATRAGILLVVGRVGPNGAGIGAWVYGDAQQQLYFASAGSYSSAEYNKSRICWVVVPKGAYYLVQQDDIAPDSGSSRFIPFKNSIAN